MTLWPGPEGIAVSRDICIAKPGKRACCIRIDVQQVYQSLPNEAREALVAFQKVQMTCVVSYSSPHSWTYQILTCVRDKGWYKERHGQKRL